MFLNFASVFVAYIFWFGRFANSAAVVGCISLASRSISNAVVDHKQRRRGRVAVCGGQIKDEDRAGMGMDGRPGRQAGRGAAGKKRRPL